MVWPDDYINKVILGDCLEIMKHIPDGAVDLVLTDPPYGELETHENHLSKITLRNGEQAGRQLGFVGLSESELIETAKIFCCLSRGWVVFTCEWQFMRGLAEAGLLVRFGIWRKPDGAPQFTGDRPGTGWEAVAICHREGKKSWNGGGRHAFWECPKSATGSHPTEKPLPLMSQFVSLFSNTGNIILDPFCGSGTTLVAAKELGRKYIGIEIEPKYCKIAEDRLRQQELF